MSSPILPGPTCPNGGYQIDYGIDEDGNGLLDDTEIDGSAIICNGTAGDPGATGFNALATIGNEPAGANCTFDGLKMEVGLDDGTPSGIAGDGILQVGEIDNTLYLCGTGSGISEGTPGTPVVIGVNQPYRATVASGGQSYYSFTAGLNWDYLIGLRLTDSDLRWTLYSNPTFTTMIASCDAHTGYDSDETCVTPTLTKGTTYYLKVEERSNIPNLFMVELAENAVLAAAGSLGEIFQVNPDTAYTSFWADSGLWNIDAMAFDPASESLISGFNSGPNAGTVYRIDPLTGAPSLLVAAASTFTGMAVRPSDGAIFATRLSECDSIYQIDPGAGTAIQVLDLNVLPYYLCFQISAMTFDGSDLAYFTSDSGFGPDLYWADLDAGTFDLVEAIDLSSFNVATLIQSMATRPTDGAIFIATDSAELGLLDMKSLVGAQIGTFHANLDGLAFIGTSGKLPPPALSDLRGNNGIGDEITWSWRPYPVAGGFNIYWKGGSYQTRPPLIDPDDPSTYDGVENAPAGVSATRDFAAEALAGCDVFAEVYAVARPVVAGVEVAKDSNVSTSYLNNCF